MTTTKIEIPVEAHVRKYLVTLYGPEHIAGKKSTIGLEVINSLTRNYEKPEKWIGPQYKYTVWIPEFYFNKNGHTIKRNNLQHLGVCLGIQFDLAMCMFLDLQVGRGHKAWPSLKEYLLFYNITEDDVKVETLYKVYQRHCKGPIKTKKKAVAA